MTTATTSTPEQRLERLYAVSLWWFSTAAFGLALGVVGPVAAAAAAVCAVVARAHLITLEARTTSSVDG